jgi:hypothetical protein
LICQFRVSDHSLGLERGRYYEIPRHLRLCEKCGVIKEPKDFTCYEEVGLRILSILSISFNVLILDGYKKSSRKAVLNLSLIVQ